MPNWCMNNLSIMLREGIKETDAHRATMQTLIAAAEAETFLDTLCPMPKDLVDTTAPSQDLNWYNWRVENWGTKWDVTNSDHYQDDGNTSFNFDSAWAPPTNALDFWSKANPDFLVQLEYWEPGMAFVGCWDSDGTDDCYEYLNYTVENVSEHIPMHLIDTWDLITELDELNYVEEMEAK